RLGDGTMMHAIPAAGSVLHMRKAASSGITQPPPTQATDPEMLSIVAHSDWARASHAPSSTSRRPIPARRCRIPLTPSQRRVANEYGGDPRLAGAVREVPTRVRQANLGVRADERN